VLACQQHSSSTLGDSFQCSQLFPTTAVERNLYGFSSSNY